MKSFKDLIMGDISNKHYDGKIDSGGIGLISLEGAPLSVSERFRCAYNKLTTLEFCPKTVGGDFDCSHNSLTTLEDAPKEVLGDFDCSNNKLVTLKHLQTKIGGKFYCHNNPNKDLEIEWELRNKNPDWSNNMIDTEMYEKTKNEIYLTQDVKEMFIF